MLVEKLTLPLSISLRMVFLYCFFSLNYNHFYQNYKNYYLQRLLSEAGLEWQSKRTPSEKQTATCLEVSWTSRLQSKEQKYSKAMCNLCSVEGCVNVYSLEYLYQHKFAKLQNCSSTEGLASSYVLLLFLSPAQSAPNFSLSLSQRTCTWYWRWTCSIIKTDFY